MGNLQTTTSDTQSPAVWDPRSETLSAARQRLWRENRYEAFEARFKVLAQGASTRTEQGRTAFYRALAEFPPAGLSQPTAADETLPLLWDRLEGVRDLADEALEWKPADESLEWKPTAEQQDDLMDLLFWLEMLVDEARDLAMSLGKHGECG